METPLKGIKMNFNATNRSLKTILLATLTLNLSGCSMFGIRSEESPKYTVTLSEDNKEIRQYSAYITASTKVAGDFKEAQNKGFRILAGYIFGDNEKADKISMTAPVVMNTEKKESEKISMTAPVLQTQTSEGWEMNFMMPSQYTSLDSLPKPKDSRVILKVVSEKTIAVIKFTGFWSEEKNRKLAEQLKEWLALKPQYELVSSPMFAGYDPPWTLPFLRRNEMMIEVRQK
jgi:hypothetical protein